MLLMSMRRRLEQLAMASMTEECPPAEQLTSYILGELEGNLQLRVAAHVRKCPICSFEDLATRLPMHHRRQYIGGEVTPVLAGTRLRNAGDTSAVRYYEAADLSVELTISAPDGDYRRITGQVIHSGSGVPDSIVTLRSGRRRRRHISDDQGFFVFNEVPAGTYTLIVADRRVQVQIRDLVINIDEE